MSTGYAKSSQPRPQKLQVVVPHSLSVLELIVHLYQYFVHELYSNRLALWTVDFHHVHKPEHFCKTSRIHPSFYYPWLLQVFVCVPSAHPIVTMAASAANIAGKYELSNSTGFDEYLKKTGASAEQIGKVARIWWCTFQSYSFVFEHHYLSLSFEAQWLIKTYFTVSC